MASSLTEESLTPSPRAGAPSQDASPWHTQTPRPTRDVAPARARVAEITHWKCRTCGWNNRPENEICGGIGGVKAKAEGKQYGCGAPREPTLEEQLHVAATAAESELAGMRSAMESELKLKQATGATAKVEEALLARRQEELRQRAAALNAAKASVEAEVKKEQQRLAAEARERRAGEGGLRAILGGSRLWGGVGGKERAEDAPARSLHAETAARIATAPPTPARIATTPPIPAPINVGASPYAWLASASAVVPRGAGTAPASGAASVDLDLGADLDDSVLDASLAEQAALSVLDDFPFDIDGSPHADAMPPNFSGVNYDLQTPYDLQSPNSRANLSRELLCPLSNTLMSDPVLCAGDGHTYERAVVTRWFETHDSSPITGEMLTSKQLIPNNTIRNLILEYLKSEQGMSAQGVWDPNRKGEKRSRA